LEKEHYSNLAPRRITCCRWLLATRCLDWIVGIQQKAEISKLWYSKQWNIKTSSV